MKKVIFSLLFLFLASLGVNLFACDAQATCPDNQVIYCSADSYCESGDGYVSCTWASGAKSEASCRNGGNT